MPSFVRRSSAPNSFSRKETELILLPPAEEFTGIDTYLKLLEWSDLNRPLMQRLSLEAPGTYAHTIAMANLVETAANAIGANGLLVGPWIALAVTIAVSNCLVELYSPRGTDDFTMATTNALLCLAFGAWVLH